ncbi:MAG: protein TolR [Gammaproteobacteria bacterium]|nr:protein TolR [Gammaproteobacteria bacterium]
MERLHSRRRRLLSEINVVPYIDVMLVLLVIFIITAPLLAQGIKVDLPKLSARLLDPKSKEPLVVSVDKEGRYYLSVSASPSSPLNTSDLVHKVSVHLRQDKTRPVLLNGDEGVSYGKVVYAMTLLQKAGAESVGLVTQSPESRKPFKIPPK